MEIRGRAISSVTVTTDNENARVDRLEREVDEICAELNTSTLSSVEAKLETLLDVEDIEMSSEESCDLAVRLMDKRYNTKFYPWVKNENNIDFIVQHLKPLVDTYDMEGVTRAFRWLFQNWSINSIANTLIKMYYERGLQDAEFAQIVNEVALGRDWKEVVDLVATLSIGEETEVNAQFIYNLTRSWDAETITDLIDAVMTRSRWPQNYYEGFIVAMAGLNAQDEASRMQIMQIYRQKFADRRREMEIIPERKLNTVQENLNHRKFCRAMMERFLGSNGQQPEWSTRIGKISFT